MYGLAIVRLPRIIDGLIGSPGPVVFNETDSISDDWIDHAIQALGRFSPITHVIYKIHRFGQSELYADRDWAPVRRELELLRDERLA